MKQLTRNSLKNIKGGLYGDGGGGDGGGGRCVGCTCGSMYSCWYSTQDAGDLCNRVYPHCNTTSSAGDVPCNGCTMN